MPENIPNGIPFLLLMALEKRRSLIAADHTSAFRLFNGFYEGASDLVVDVYGSTLILFINSKGEAESIELAQLARDTLLISLPWIKCVLVKYNHAAEKELRNGVITFGKMPDESIIENGVRYALEPCLNQDASFYIDTRNLRAWLITHSKGLDVLNTFAYTGSLGVAALAGGASRVIQLDRNGRFLNLARQSAMLNHHDLGKMKLTAVDFFVGAGQLKRARNLFDLVILDPPFFSVTEKGLVDQARECHRLINKVRPLVKNEGRIVAINNSLFLEGVEYLRSLEALCQDGFMEIEEIIPVPEDITGYADTVVQKPPVDPAPFNHPTKIVILKVKRKDYSRT